MEEPLIKGVLSTPGTALIAGVCIAIYAHRIWREYPVENIAISYRTFIKEKQYWRGVTAIFSHLNLLHIVFNVSSLWTMRSVEKVFGTITYFRISYILLIVSVLVTMGIYHIWVKYGGIREYETTYAVGYSGVIFGIMTVGYMSAKQSKISLFGFSIPLSLAPFGSLLLTQLLVPGASFVGHLSGIIAGYMYSWGFFSWLGNDFFAFALFWSVVLLVWSIKTTSNFDIPFIQIGRPADEDDNGNRNGLDELRQVRIENGVLVSSPSNV